jgi:hypothetical protein
LSRRRGLSLPIDGKCPRVLLWYKKSSSSMKQLLVDDCDARWLRVGFLPLLY